MVRVKICGITNLGDAEFAIKCGADALGFIFAESPRRVTVSQASKIIKRVGPWTATVGVFVNENSATIKKIAAACGFGMVQLHGDETAGLIEKLSPLKVIQVLRIQTRRDLSGIKRFKAAAFLFDTKAPDHFGGTGKTFDWDLIRQSKISQPVILSGGLKVSNVREAIKRVRPYGVDVSSGVEKSLGKKDPAKVREFIFNAKKT